ncbi:hypothetical protein M404DRAFT_510041 [Pisolithus tinctorius Marx 270]|uniref:Uncharacterized protein n=1 Tax=Pisolithus tinctorius Marx 270 TaxID=870435 RepID=A0A0C3MX33_PISTI|nr:hypothetical protein M404DRAFT_510041 [Pisolithus tinctorius Marx 270]
MMPASKWGWKSVIPLEIVQYCHTITQCVRLMLCCMACRLFPSSGLLLCTASAPHFGWEAGHLCAFGFYCTQGRIGEVINLFDQSTLAW